MRLRPTLHAIPCLVAILTATALTSPSAAQGQRGDYRQMQRYHFAALASLEKAEAYLANGDVSQAAAELRQYEASRAQLDTQALPKIIQQSIDSWTGRAQRIRLKLDTASATIQSPGSTDADQAEPGDVDSSAPSQPVESPEQASDPFTRQYADPPMPPFRVVTTGFGDSEPDIRRLIESAGRELWRFFPDYEIEPFVVVRGYDGPIVDFRRNDQGQIVMRLDTCDQRWSQYSYQFAHEFCHILCGFENDYKGNQWFEESICQAASLFVLRRMAQAWKHDPPYSHWRSYGMSLQSYAQSEINSHAKAERSQLGALYRQHQQSLRTNGKFPAVFEPFSIILLEMFEEDPTRWESIRWLNSSPSPQDETLQQYLAKWYAAVPQRHKAFVARIAGYFDIDVAKEAGDNAPNESE